MTRILVTGANGHLGANIVRSLLQRGHGVVPFIRRTSNLQGLEGLDLTYRYGDMLDLDSLKAAAEGCEVIIHTAAVYRFWVTDPADLVQETLEGTRNVFEAAKTAGVKRIIYTSTTFAVGASTDPDILYSPNDWNGEPLLPYAKAKVKAEKLAWQLAEETGISLIVFCPDGIMGPFDYSITQSMALLKGWLDGTVVTSLGGASFVDVRDVAEVHAQAVTKGELGQRYIIAGERLSMKDWGEIVTRLTGIKPKHIGAGRRASWLMGGLMELKAKLTGSQPTLTRAMALEFVDRYHYYDCTKTEQAFDFAPRQGEEVIADAIRWLNYVGEIDLPETTALNAYMPSGGAM